MQNTHCEKDWMNTSGRRKHRRQVGKCQGIKNNEERKEKTKKKSEKKPKVKAETDASKGRNDMMSERELKSDSQYHLLLAEWVFGFDLQLLHILISDLGSFSGAPALVGCREI